MGRGQKIVLYQPSTDNFKLLDGDHKLTIKLLILCLSQHRVSCGWTYTKIYNRYLLDKYIFPTIFRSEPKDNSNN